jgi:hypothetical protein
MAKYRAILPVGHLIMNALSWPFAVNGTMTRVRSEARCGVVLLK